MKTSVLSLIGAGVLAVAGAGTADAQTVTPWVHIRVEEAHKESRVSVNLPFSLVQAALDLAPERITSHGRIHLEHCHDVSVADLRKVWKEVRATGQAELLTAEEKDQKVTVTREGERFRLKVEKGSHRETVNVELPLAVVDALLSGEGSELNLRAALAEIKNLRGDLVRVDDDDSKVRIWIDERS